MKVLIFGDIGGHADLFRRALEEQDVDIDSSIIPENTHIIQVGDLVDRGPDSDGVVHIVDKMIDHPRWTQLIGNHEARFLGGPNFGTPHTMSEPSPESVAKIRAWYKDEKMHVAAGLGIPETLITHAGLSFPLWDWIGSPTSVESTVNLLNLLPEEIAFRSGERLGGEMAGPVWTSAWNELIVPWYSALSTEYLDEVPYSQIHGHDTLYSWNSKKFVFYGNPKLEGNMWYNRVNRVSSFHLSDCRDIVQVDPGLGTYAFHVPRPYVVHGVDRVIV